MQSVLHRFRNKKRLCSGEVAQKMVNEMKKWLWASVMIALSFALQAEEMGIRNEGILRYYASIYRSNLERIRREIDNAKTREDALKLVERAKRRVAEAIPIPAVRPPVSAVCTGIVKFDDFKIEKLIIRSREGFSMPANFYLPNRSSGKLPVIVFLAGHGSVGKADYPTAITNFARQGVAVLALDPIHQGERFQFDEKKIGLVQGHNLLNRQLVPLGETFAEWRVYDVIRGIDYVMTRKEIDPGRIGLNGNSGGGTLTAFAGALDDRIKAVAPSCYITTLYHNVANELPTDGEQVPHNLGGMGGEMVDLVIAHAPKPYHILAQKQDFFDIRGARETYRLAKKVYKLLGCEENIQMTEGPQPHTYGRPLRRAASKFFAEELGFKFQEEPAKFARPKASMLRCLQVRSVLDLPGEKSVQDFLREKALRLKKIRGERRISREGLEKKLRSLLDIPDKTPLVDHRLWRYAVSDKNVFSRFGIETEKELFTTLFRQKPVYSLTPAKRVELYLPAKGCRDELGGLKVLTDGFELWGLDYQGIGESIGAGGFEEVYQGDYLLASCGISLGKPFVGRRTGDILKAVRLLKENGAEEIVVRASGLSVIPAIFAAVLTDIPYKTVLHVELVSYTAHVCSKDAPIPQSFIPYDILKLTDLDELVRMYPERFVIDKR